MVSLVAGVRAYCERHGLVPAGSGVLVALSGGPDSLALLDLLAVLSRERELRLHALTIDHGLRGGSSAEAAAASALAERIGVSSEVLSLGLEATSNVQELAREARLAALEQTRVRLGFDLIALGHTADDQAETVLLRLLRGAGPRGLAAMAPRRGALVRPLLGSRRAELEAWLQTRGLEPLRDPSNELPRYARNRLRQVVLPELAAENPRVVEALCRLAASCREEHEALEALAAKLYDDHVTEGVIELAALRCAPRGLRHRVWARAYGRAMGSQRRLNRGHLEDLDELCQGQQGTAWLDLPGLRVERRYDRLWMPATEARALEPVEITGPGFYSLGAAGELEVRAELLERDHRDALPARLVQPPLSVRAFSGGERLPIALQRHRAVGRILIDEKVPRTERKCVPLVYQGDALVLLVGVRRAAGWACEAGEIAWVFRQHR